MNETTSKPPSTNPSLTTSEAEALVRGEKLVTLFRTRNYQPTDVDTGMTGEWWAFPSTFVVDLHTDLEEGRQTVTMHGRWTERDAALRFANTCPGPTEVRDVPLYWYAPAYGKVD